MDGFSKDVNFEEICERSYDVLLEELGADIDTLRLALLVGRLLQEMNPDIETRPVITRAAAMSAPGLMEFYYDSTEEELGLPLTTDGFASSEYFKSTPKEKLGTIDEDTGRLVGYACVLLWSKTSGQHYFLDPAQFALESEELEIVFDRHEPVAINKDEREVVIGFDNGVTAVYSLFPENALPELSADTLSKLDSCVPKVMRMLKGSRRKRRAGSRRK